MRKKGFKAGRFDVKYGPSETRRKSNYMGLTQPVASCFPDNSCDFLLALVLWCFKRVSRSFGKLVCVGLVPFRVCVCWPRLAVVFLLRCREKFFALFAIKCSSFSKMNRGTSKRSECSSTGYEPYKSVQEANQLLERRAALM